jgi:hypothetical protein
MEYTKEFVSSSDYTRVDYKLMGDGPGLILLHREC